MTCFHVKIDYCEIYNIMWIIISLRMNMIFLVFFNVNTLFPKYLYVSKLKKSVNKNRLFIFNCKFGTQMRLDFRISFFSSFLPFFFSFFLKQEYQLLVNSTKLNRTHNARFQASERVWFWLLQINICARYRTMHLQWISSLCVCVCMWYKIHLRLLNSQFHYIPLAK